VNTAWAAFGQKAYELKALQGGPPQDIALKASEVLTALKDLLDAISGGTADDATSVVLLGYIYRVLIPQMANAPHWQQE
jgi:hypothetical protein